jgi:hypothetical protein
MTSLLLLLLLLVIDLGRPRDRAVPFLETGQPLILLILELLIGHSPGDKLNL